MQKNYFLSTFILALLFSFAFVFTSCDSDDEEPSPFVGKWKLTTASQIVTTTLNDSLVSEEDILASCVKDDVIELTSDNVVLVDEGATNCGQNSAQVEGTWRIDSEFETLITISLSASSNEDNKSIEGEYNLDAVNSKTLTISGNFTSTEVNGLKRATVKTLIFTKQ